MNKHASLNKLYRLVWSDVHDGWVAVAEHIRARGKGGGQRSQRAAVLAAMSAAGFASGIALAAPPPLTAGTLPTGGVVSAGGAVIGSSGATMQIDQSTQRAVIDWTTFNVGSAATVRFIQPSASSATLNRVQDNNASQIAGRVTANGTVIISNPNGVLFTPTASVDVGALVATTHDISNADFMAGLSSYSRNGATGSVKNQGELRAALGGYIALMAPEVRNEGIIVAQAGTVVLAAGEMIRLDFDANNTLAGITATPSQIRALVENKQAVYAPGGLIVLSARAVGNLQGGVVQNSGTLSATSLSARGGRIVLDGDDVQLAAGSRTEARGATQGGSIDIKAGSLDLAGSVDAGGASGGAVSIQTSGDARVSASVAVQGLSGAGGEIRLQSGGTLSLTADARAEASGTSQGGRIALSASGLVRIDGATLDASSGNGAGGALALDSATGIQLHNATLQADGDSAGGSISLASPSHPLNDPLAPPTTPPNVALSGATTASAGSRRGRGGLITLSGRDLLLEDTTTLSASGATGGGMVLVGGGWQGSGSLPQATSVIMGEQVVIDASATDNGDGGTVVLWSDVTNAASLTQAHGTIFARGGDHGGDGGRIETSGHFIDVTGVQGSAAAPLGSAGEWLFDPTNITIGSGGNTAGAANNGSSLTASSVSALLNGGTNVTITTYSGGGDLGNIFVDSAVTKSSGSANVTLTLRAANVIAINQNITHTGGTGKLNLVFDADNDTGSSTSGATPSRDGAGIVILEANLSTGGGNLTIGGTTSNGFTGGDLYVGGGSNAISITTGGGNVDIKGQLILANSSASGLTINTGGGSIDLRGAVDSGNQYTAVSGTWTWLQALDNADNAANSYLATVTSSLENALAIRAAGYSDAWLGGRRLAGTNLWQWVADPAYNVTTNPLTFFYQASASQTQLSSTSSGYGGTTATGYYANWNGWTNGSTSGSEPNNWSGSTGGAFSGDYESALQFTGTQGKWNDLPYNSTTLNQYVRETNLAPSKLTLNAGSGAVTVGGAIGANKALASLNVTASSTTVNGAAVITTGAQTYNNALTVTSTGHLEIAASSLAITNANQNLTLTAGGGDLTIKTPLSVKGASGGNSDVTLKASRHISVQDGANIIDSSGGAINLTFWADSDNSGDGLTAFSASTIDTRGGALQFGHNETATINRQSVKVGGDLYLSSAAAQTFATGGGALNVYGETILANTSAQGVTLNTSGGAVNFHGLLNSGNQYGFVAKTGTGYGGWDAARTEAKNGTAGGSATGDSYLVTITSRLENMIAGLAAGYKGAWIGAYRPDTNNYNWAWADGPEANVLFFTQGTGSATTPNGTTVSGYYANFGIGEPNGGLAAIRTNTESVGQFFGSAGLWNDLSHTTYYNANASQYVVTGFVRETNVAPTKLTINAGSGSVTINGSVGSGKALASLNVTASSTTINGNAIVTTGGQAYNNALTVNATGDLNISGTTLNVTGANQSLLFKATGSIVQATGMDIITNGGNAVYWADSDGTGGGTITLTGGGLVQTNGGGIWMGGGQGSTTWMPKQGGGTINVGNSVASGGQYGINIENSALNAGTGNVSLNGTSTWTGGNYGVGVRVFSSGVGNAAAISGRDISLNGTGATGTGASTGHWGVAVLAYSGSTSGISAGGTLNIAGTAGGSGTTGGSNHGVLIQGGSLSSLGDLAITGIGGGKAGGAAYNDGVHIENATVSSGAGNLTLTGTKGLNASSYGIGLFGTNLLGHAGSQTGNLILRSNALSVAGTSFLSSGRLTVEPLGVSFDSALTLDSNWTLGSLSGLTLGKAGNTADVTLSSALSIAGAVNVYGGNIQLNQNLNTTAGGSAGDVLFKASGDIAVAADKSITTAAGDVILWANSDGQTQNGGVFFDSASGITTGGGHIWVGGGSGSSIWNGLTVGNGYAVAGKNLSAFRKESYTTAAFDWEAGIFLDEVSISSGGGNIYLAGQRNAQTTYANGGGLINYNGASGSTIDAGTGTITLIGNTANVGAVSWGLMTGLHPNASNGIFTLRSGNTTATEAIKLTGQTLSAQDGILIEDRVRILSTAASGGGGITLTGTSTGRNGLSVGIGGNSGTLEVLSASGAITVDVGIDPLLIAPLGTFRIGSISGDAAVASSTANVTIISDDPSWSGSVPVRTTGTLTVKPSAGRSFTTAFNTAALNYIGITGLTIGHAANTGGVTIGAATSIAGPITIYGGNIAINGATTATASTIALTATGSVTQTAALVADHLVLNGSGTFSLSNAGNTVNTVAGGSIGIRLGSLAFANSGALGVGTVGSTSGLWAQGNIQVETLTGDLTLSQSIDTLSSSTAALILNAGKNAAAGTSTGGDIVFSGSPGVNVGAGGRATLYTGSLSGSTGLTSLVGSASGRFRYNSDESASNFTLALGGGRYAIYRERPTLVVTADTKTITYGDSPTLTATATGTTYNGDTLASALPNPLTSAVFDSSNNPVTASANGTAYYDAGSYTLSVGTVNSVLGYAVTKVDGALTVQKKEITITADNAGKIYSQPDPTFTVSYSGLALGETSVTDGTRMIGRAPGATAGDYAITPDGVASTSNYTIRYLPGTLTIVPAQKLLVTVGATSRSYGTEAIYTVTGASYEANGTLVPLTLTDATGGALVSGNTVTFTDGASQTISLHIDGVGSRNGMTGFYNVGTYSLQATNITSGIASITQGVTVAGNLYVTPKVLSLGATKVYDGNQVFNGVINTGVGSETLNYTNGLANSANVAEATHFTAMTLVNGSNGGVTSNYILPDLTQATGLNAVSVTPRTLTLAASKTYDGNIAIGVGSIALGGLVAGESLGISAATGSSTHVADANKYIKDITLDDSSNGAGLVSNYRLLGGAATSSTPTSGTWNGLSYVAGQNTLSIGARQLAISLANSDVSKVYDGSASAKIANGSVANADFVPQFVIANAVAGDSFTLGGYTAAYNSPNVLTANALNISGIGIDALTSATANSLASDYAWNTSTSVVARITPRPVAVSGGTSVSKVYDGTTAMNNVLLTFTGTGQVESGVVMGQTLSVSGGVGSFSSESAGIGKSYSLSGFSLSADPLTTDVSNYSLPGGGGSLITGNDGVIYKRPLAITFTGDNKVYDGTTSATVGASFANAAYAPVAGDDLVINRTASFGSKNVNSGTYQNSVAVTNVTLSGNDADNYTVSYLGSDPLHSPTVGNQAGYNATATGEITRLDSVTWVGGATGDWFTAANWAMTSNTALTGVVPDLGNVANVIIPGNQTVSFNNTGPAVLIESLSAGLGGLNVTCNPGTCGRLEVGSAGADLYSYSQSGGTVTSVGGFFVRNSFSQTGGTLSTTGPAATVSIVQASGDLAWSNLSSGGDLILDSAGKTGFGTTTVGGNLLSLTHGVGVAGGVTQSGTVVVAGTAEFVADTGAGQDAVLSNAANDFQAPVSFRGANGGSWQNVAVRDTNSLTLGEVTASGLVSAHAMQDIVLNGDISVASLALTATNGDITQPGGALTVASGPTNLQAGGDITLSQANDFNGNVNVLGGHDVTLNDSNSLSLGNVAITGHLGATAAQNLALHGTVGVSSLDLTAMNGNITQPGGALTVASGPTNLRAGNDIDLSQSSNDFNGAVNAGGRDVRLVDGHGGLVLGDIAARGGLAVSSTGGNITQAAGTGLNVHGASTFAASNGANPADVILDSAANDFVSAVALRGRNLVIHDSAGHLTLGQVTASGTLEASSTAGDILQDLGSAISVAGSAAFNTSGPGARILLAAGNNFAGGLTVSDSLPPADAVVLVPAAPTLAMPTPENAPPEISAPTSPVAPSAANVTTVSTPTSGATESPVSVTSASAPQESGADKVAATNTSGLSILVVREPSGQQSGLVVVRLPESAAAGGFRFVLPERLSEGSTTPAISVSLADGTPLPNWLRFDAESRTVQAASVPPGVLPLKLGVRIGNVVTIIEIS